MHQATSPLMPYSLYFSKHYACINTLHHVNFIYLNNKSIISMHRVNQTYAYISHPQHLPLQIDGRSKKRATPIKKEEFNGERPNINESSRTLLMKKLCHNIHELAQNKSVIPVQGDRKKVRPNSIKTFSDNKENIKSSGVEFLMQKTENLKPISHKQKAHIGEFQPPQAKRPEKKHFIGESTEKAEHETHSLKNHRQTVDLRLANDLYSNVYRAEKEVYSTKKLEQTNLFRNGEDLGLEKKREKKVSDHKLIELIGSDYLQPKHGVLRERRQDWRTSNIYFC